MSFLFGIYKFKSCRIYILVVLPFDLHVRTGHHVRVNFHKEVILQFGIQFQVLEALAIVECEFSDFQNVGKVEGNHTAVGKYVTADFGYTGRNVYGSEFGAVLECSVFDFRKVLRQSHAREICTAAEHLITCKSHIPGKFDALEAGAVLETSMQFIYLVVLENDFLQILATIKS